MESVMKEFEHHKIPLRELEEATNKFRSKVIGVGGFGKVFEGEVSHSKGRTLVAIKRLSREFGQGDSEFWKEVMTLSRYTHKNLISLLGYCDEDGEKILVYEHASNGSLDRHLSSTVLTWTQRLNICLDAARGIAYLHEHKGTQQRVIHRDIKSANILLDHNWNAKVSDMGLSKIGPANQPHTVLFTNVAGTPGYCDPQYMYKYSLTKESDIYSFGVVLFEVLCGRLCFRRSNGRLEVLVPAWKQSYEHNEVDQIIFKGIMPPMDPAALEIFTNVAFQCLHDSREQRPKASVVVAKLEIALKFQESRDMIRTNDIGSSHVDELGKLLTERNEGIEGKTKIDGAKGDDAEGNGTWRCVHFDDTMRLVTPSDLLKTKVVITGADTYGTDYKVILNNGLVGLKGLKQNITKGQEEFEVELNLIGRIRHLNLMAMRAYYLGPNEEKLLIYDYMPRGSLADFLHARRLKTPVDWATRMQIAKGVARGLLTLHSDHEIVHGNLTSNHIMLDENTIPKISYFGLHRLMTDAANSDMIEKTTILGYQAPELASLEIFNTDADVYSFGVIMLELLTGRTPGKDTNGLELPQWINLMGKNKRTDEIYDNELTEDASTVDYPKYRKTFLLALQCISTSASVRPDLSIILRELEEIDW